MATLSVEPNDQVTFRACVEDEHLIVVEKRSGLATQPGLGHERDTLLNALFARFGSTLQNLGASRDFGLLHRLDKDTSGLLVVALSVRAYDLLRASFEAREVRKFYWALCAKPPKEPTGLITLPLIESGGTRGKPKLSRVSRSRDSKPAATAYRVLQASDRATLIECRPLTGRLHQVRVHLDAIGCPILGDEFYAIPAIAGSSPRLALHAHRLAFTHPITREAVDVRSKWPHDLKPLLKRMKLERPDQVAPPAGRPADSSDDAPPE
ncbi:MAG: RluA family pseudouridine synthase [Phycisphaeraceae bacterium]|nr:RluA family pseudouridine synthase [Phycisphaeraceae bacterium]